MLGKLKALSSGFYSCYAIDESGVCEGRPIGQREMRQMAQCLRELGFVQERNATERSWLGERVNWLAAETQVPPGNTVDLVLSRQGV